MPKAGRPGPAPAPAGLRLRAEDAEDLAVISACLQDALVSVGDLAYDRRTRTFVAIANRFRWESAGGDRENEMRFERTLCAVEFGGVEAAAYRGFERGDEKRILSLLAIRDATAPSDRAPVGAMPRVTAGVTIDLEFAGGATIRLSAAAIRCRVGDFGEPGQTARQPGHELDTPQ